MRTSPNSPGHETAPSSLIGAEAVEAFVAFLVAEFRQR